MKQEPVTEQVELTRTERKKVEALKAAIRALPRTIYLDIDTFENTLGIHKRIAFRGMAQHIETFRQPKNLVL